MRQKEEKAYEQDLGGGRTGQPYVDIDNEDDGSKDGWLTWGVIIAVAVAGAIVVAALML